MFKDKEEIIEDLFSYIFKRANKYGLNVVLSIDGITRITLNGEPSETYANLYNELNKDIILENEWKRRKSLTVQDLFDKISELYNDSPELFGKCKRDGVTHIEQTDHGRIFEVTVETKDDSDYNTICFSYIPDIKDEHNDSLYHNIFTIELFEKGNNHFYMSFDFEVDKSQNGKMSAALCYRDIFSFDFISQDYYKPFSENNSPLTIGDFVKTTDDYINTNNGSRIWIFDEKDELLIITVFAMIIDL